MKPYYKGHETIYEKLKLKGANCWGEDDFEHVHMLDFVRRALHKTGLDRRPQVRALVIGCGTGPIAYQLSLRGYFVEGIDVSPTAIEMAKREAQARRADITYRVSDICVDPISTDQYDLILDSHCLHCIVTENDRANVLSSIRSGLKPDGFFILETMIGTNSVKEHRSDEEGVVWANLGTDEPDYKPRKQKNGVWYIPQRRLRPTSEAMRNELLDAGFRVVWNNTEVPEQTALIAGDLQDYQAICTRLAP